MRCEKRKTLDELLSLLPARYAYWSPEGERLCDAAKKGLCIMKTVGYPYWEFTNATSEPALEVRKAAP